MTQDTTTKIGMQRAVSKKGFHALVVKGFASKAVEHGIGKALVNPSDIRQVGKTDFHPTWSFNLPLGKQRLSTKDAHHIIELVGTSSQGWILPTLLNKVRVIIVVLGLAILYNVIDPEDVISIRETLRTRESE